MPHFVVTEFHGVEQYAVEFFFSPTLEKRNIIAAIEIDGLIASFPLDVLIDYYKNGVRPKAGYIAQQQKLPAPTRNPQLAMG